MKIVPLQNGMSRFCEYTIRFRGASIAKRVWPQNTLLGTTELITRSIIRSVELELHIIRESLPIVLKSSQHLPAKFINILMKIIRLSISSILMKCVALNSDDQSQEVQALKTCKMGRQKGILNCRNEHYETVVVHYNASRTTKKSQRQIFVQFPRWTSSSAFR